MKKIYTVEQVIQDYTRSQEKSTTKFNGTENSEESKHLDEGWSWVVLFSSFCTCCLIGANNYGTGIIHEILLQRYRESISLTAWSGALQLGMMCVSAPIASMVVDKYSCRTSVVFSGLFFICGYIATAFVPTMKIAIFTCGVTGGFAAGLGYTACIVVIGFNFKKRKNLALGITLSGMGAGIFAFAPLMEWANNFYGSTGFFFIQAALSANIITFGTLLFPSKLELQTHKQRKNAKQESRDKSGVVTIKMYWRAVANKPVMMLCVYMFGFCCGTDLVFLHFPSYVVSKGFSSTQAAFLVSLNGIMSVLGRLLLGFVSNFTHEIKLLSCCLGIVGIITIVYPFVSSIYVGQIVYAVLLGLFFGSGYLFVSPSTSHFVDLTFASAAIGMVLFFGGVGSIVGPVFAGLLIDYGGTYEQSFFVAGSCVIVASVCSLLSLCFKSARDQQLEEDIVASNASTKL